MSTRSFTDEFVQQVSEELRTRYELDDEDIRALGSKLAGSAEARREDNLAFAERFTQDHRETFNRLAQ